MITPEMYIIEWIIPLGCYHVPLEHTVGEFSDSGSILYLSTRQRMEFLLQADIAGDDYHQTNYPDQR